MRPGARSFALTAAPGVTDHNVRGVWHGPHVALPSGTLST
ncbi:MAG: hypothetical protein ACI8PZ_004685 [Myxococcota bacterium]|jgi:hypothetical protein